MPGTSRQQQRPSRVRAMGAASVWAALGIIALCVGLYSVSLGAVWAVALTSILAFAGTTLLAGVAYRSALTRLGRD